MPVCLVESSDEPADGALLRDCDGVVRGGVVQGGVRFQLEGKRTAFTGLTFHRLPFEPIQIEPKDILIARFRDGGGALAVIRDQQVAVVFREEGDRGSPARHGKGGSRAGVAVDERLVENGLGQCDGAPVGLRDARSDR